MTRWLLALLMLVAIFFVASFAVWFFVEPLMGIAVGFGLISWMLVNGLKTIPADPPHVGIVTFLGKRMEHAIPEGLHFFPIYPIVFGVILVDVTQKEHDMQPAQSFTPEDKTAMTAKISYTLIPDQDNIIAYENANGPEGVIAILDDLIEEAFRERMSNGEAPATWEEAVKMDLDFLVTVVAPLLPFLPNNMPPADARQTALRLRKGTGKLVMPSLGIILKRLNVTDIRPTDSKVIEAAQKRAIEAQEKKSETADAATFLGLVDQLIAKGIDSKVALEAIQLRRKDITKNVEEKRYGTSAELDATIKAIATEIASTIARRNEGRS